jgi:hypothetical protein
MFHSYLGPAGQSIRLGRFEKSRRKQYNSGSEKRVARFQNPQAMTDENQTDEGEREIRRKVNDQETYVAARRPSRTLLPEEKSARLGGAYFQRSDARYHRI